MLLAVQNASVLRQMARAGRPQSAGLIAEAVGRDVDNVRKSLKLLEAEGLLQLVTVDGLKCADLTSEGRDVVPRLDVLEGRRNLDPNSLELFYSQIERDPLNPRKTFDQASLEELADAITAARGLIQPLAVKPTEDPETFRIVDGERRWRAIDILMNRGDWDLVRRIPCVLRLVTDDSDHEFTSLIANVAREDMNAIEEANAIERLLERERPDGSKIRVGELADALGKTRRFVEKRRQLLKLPAILQIEVAKGLLSIEGALKHVQEPKAAEAVAAPAPQPAARAGPNLTPAQALIMIEVAIATELDDGANNDLGASARLPKPPNFAKSPDAATLASEGLLSFQSQWPYAVTILKPGVAWLAATGGANIHHRRPLALQAAGVMPFEIEALEAEDRYHTPWLNEPPKAKGPPAPVISDLAALVLLELEDAVSKQPSYFAYVRHDVDRDAVREACAQLIAFQNSPQDGLHYAWTMGNAGAALRARWPGYDQGGEVFMNALAEIRSKVLPPKDLKALEKRGGYATPWLNGPFQPDPAWKAARAKDAEDQRQRDADKAEREEWLAGVAEAIDVFETEALDMTEAQIRARFVELLAKGRAPAPWCMAEPSVQHQFYARTPVDTYVGMSSSPNSRRLAIMAVNIAAGIPAKDWPPAAEDEDKDPALADQGGGPVCEECGEEVGIGELNEAGLCDDCAGDPQGSCESCGEEHPYNVLQDGLCPSCSDKDDDGHKACASCGESYPVADLDEDGACHDCVTAEEADADAEAALSGEG